MSKKSPGNTTLFPEGVSGDGGFPPGIPIGGSLLRTSFDRGSFPYFDSKEAVQEYLEADPRIWEDYLGLPENMRRELIGFCMGKNGLRITYDTVFRKIFDPVAHPERLQGLLSAVLGHMVRIVKVVPRDGTQLSERAGFVIMDVLVQLDDGSYANVEMQKLGYDFPISRADCYASDIILRQYTQVRAVRGDAFSFDDLHKVYCIILMEKSPGEFHARQKQYAHRRTASFDTGIYKENSGLHEDIFICLDSFHENVHTITKDSKELDAWMTFLSAVELEEIDCLVRAFPEFITIYQEIAAFIRKPEEVLRMLSEALYIMDRNMEYKMAQRAMEEAEKEKKMREAVQKEAEAAQKEAEKRESIFRLAYRGYSVEEIAQEVSVSAEEVSLLLFGGIDR